MLSRDPVPLEAWVEGNVDEKRLKEYQVEHPHDRQAGVPHTTCFLETINEPFSIKIQFLDQKTFKAHQWFVQCSVDRQTLAGGMWVNNPAYRYSHFVERKDGLLYQSDMKFSPLPTTDDEENVTIDNAQLQDLGKIKILVHFGQWVTTRSEGKAHSVSMVSGTVHEKTKKGVNPKVIADTPSPTSYTFVVDKNGKNYYRFTFKYRPRPVLELMGVIEGEPEPTDLEVKDQQPQVGDGPASTAEKVKVENEEKGEEGPKSKKHKVN
uniref:DUF7918 domain-containing protein n=1 Tax=Kwoniella bestiolae CBS 10118 TaxID=1296100 RepID=A0A1B9GEG4_9TREE|nr:hypothetical protein I302_00853 [Kwoniella bestiolae CBS 10118]OCF29351.1 hypothetical protein I302_00853 [Kwoniella bestiolae CBS 10118]